MVEKRKLALKVATLSQSEQQALQAFISRLRQNYPHQIRKVALFGSKARGDSDADSDVDILIIVNKDDRYLRRGIIDMASDFSLEYDILLSPRVIGEQRWKTRQDFGLYRNIARDALPISMEE
jgi:uncharacterized protein